MLSQDRLKYLFSYDAHNGLFTRTRDEGRAKAGFTPQTPNTSGYIVIRIDRQLYLAHRLVFLYVDGEFPPFDVDHVNGVRSDNRFENLRAATRSENNQNRRHYRATSKVPGTYGHKRLKKWAAQIRIEGRNVHIGYYASLDEAGKAYLDVKEAEHPYCEIAKERHLTAS